MADPIDPNKPQQPTPSTTPNIPNAVLYEQPNVPTLAGITKPAVEVQQGIVATAAQAAPVSNLPTSHSVQQPIIQGVVSADQQEVDMAKRQIQQSVLGNVRGSVPIITRVEWLIGNKKFTSEQLALLKTEASLEDANSKLVLEFYNAMQARDEGRLVKLFLDNSRTIYDRSSRLSILVTTCRRLRAGLPIDLKILTSLETVFLNKELRIYGLDLLHNL